jgi:diamine N-acetyltransferase
MTPIIWSDAELSDADALSVLGSATFLTSFAFDHPGPALLQFLKDMHNPDFYRAALSDPNIAIIIGKTPLGAPVGYAMITPPEHPELQQDGDIELKRIYLLHPWQGGGNGRALIDLAIAKAIQKNGRRIILAVYESNPNAIGFYQKMGFEKVGETIFMVGDAPFSDHLYAKRLID